jgi:hypothetical protein
VIGNRQSEKAATQPRPFRSPITNHRSPSSLTFGERAPTVCRHPVSGTVSLPSSGCFSPFPHGTGSLSVAEEYLGLEGGPPVFRQDFTCPALLVSLARIRSIRGCHPLRPGFPAGSGKLVQERWPDPRSLATTDGVSLMSFPPGTEMFQFPGFAFIPLFCSENKSFMRKTENGKRKTDIPSAVRPPSSDLRKWVSPFGNSWIKACSRLPMTYRSVPRPSSPLSAKASTECP